MTRLGFYREPEGGLTDIPDTAMFEALEVFQDMADLDERGSMVPNGSMTWKACRGRFEGSKQ